MKYAVYPNGSVYEMESIGPDGRAPGAASDDWFEVDTAQLTWRETVHLHLGWGLQAVGVIEEIQEMEGE